MNGDVASWRKSIAILVSGVNGYTPCNVVRVVSVYGTD